MIDEERERDQEDVTQEQVPLPPQEEVEEVERFAADAAPPENGDDSDDPDTEVIKNLNS